MARITCPQVHLLALAVLAGCGDPAGAGSEAAADPGTDTDPGTTADPGNPGSTGDSGDDTTTGDPAGCALVEVPCVDAAIQDLSLQDDKVSDAVVTSERDGDDWVSRVDASAGGTMAAAMNPWVYLRFTDAGLERVDLDDVAALASGAWDIAAKRYGIRVNSGSSGPSCVTVAAPAGDYANLDAAPPADQFAAEDYYDDACVLQEDGSGLPGSPAYRMASWWGYTGCVTTTGFPFALRLGDGRAVKLVVETYYESGQAECNSGGAMGTGAAQMTWRWSFLP